MANEQKHFIKSFQIKNFRGIIDSGKIEFITNERPQPPQWVFLTGENGFGKTSVLQALAAGLYGIENVNALTYEEKKQAQISIVLPIRAKAYIGNSGQNFDQLIAYGANRLKRDSKSDNLPTDSLFNKPTVFLSIDDILTQFMLQLHDQKDGKKYKKAFKTLQGIFCKIIPDLERIEISDDVIKNILYKEKFAEKALMYDYLSTGFRSWITLIGDILKRYYKTNQKVFNTSKLKLIILIDEFDLHLHPKWQRKLPSLLSGIFKNVQFIVSTHSPIPLLGAPENSAFLKVTRNEKEGIKIENLDYIEVRNLTPNTILTSPIFDFVEMTPESHKPYERLKTGDYSEEEYFDLLEEQMRRTLSQKNL